MTELCPKCLNKEEVIMKRSSVSKAISKTTVDSLFTSEHMYLPHHCPKCKFEVSLITYRWHFLEGSWICMKCTKEEEEGNVRFDSEDVIKTRLASAEDSLHDLIHGRRDADGWIQGKSKWKPPKWMKNPCSYYKKRIEAYERQLTLPLTKRRGIQELEKSVKGNIIHVKYSCRDCGNEWTTKIEFYR